MTVLFITAVWSGFLFAAEPNEFTFVNFSDSHVPTYGFSIGLPLDDANLLKMPNQQRIQQFVKECLAMKPKPDFVINSGDTGDAGWIPLLKLYQKLMQPLVSAGIPVYTVVGNHDLDYAGIAREDLAEIFDPLGPELIKRHGTRYSFDHRDCHFVILNNRPMSGLIRFAPDELEWLRNDLKKVKKDKRILVFMHANMTNDDTCRIVEIIQRFNNAVIFHGHTHSNSIGKWGGVPVIVTGSLYGGSPKAGSYRVVTVQPEKILLKTRDFAETAVTFGPEELVEFPKPRPQLRILKPEQNVVVSESITLAAETDPAVPGTLEYFIPGFKQLTSVPGKNGKWETMVPVTTTPGYHFLELQFKADDGSIVLGHVDFRVPGEKVREVWAKNVGSAVHGEPVIWQNLVIIPTIEQGAYAFRLDDGKEVWHRKVKQGQILGRVAVDGTAVYFGAGRTVYACEAKNGKLLWQTSLKGTIISGVTAGNGKLFVPAGEHELYCLDASKGEILWEYQVELPIIMEPATDGSRVFFGSMDVYYYALDAVTGKEIWKYQWSSKEDNYTTAPFWTPVLAGDKVIAGKSPARKKEKNLVAFEASSGKILWSSPLTGWPLRFVADPGKGKFYTTYTQNRSRGVQCLSVEDGSSLWNNATGVGLNAGCLAGDTVLIRNEDSLCCVEAGTGEVRWTYRTSTSSQGSLYGVSATAVKDNQAIVGTMDGRVIALKW